MATVNTLTAANGYYGYSDYTQSAANHLYIGADSSGSRYDYRSRLTFRPLSSLPGVGSNRIRIVSMKLYVTRNNGGPTEFTVGCSNSAKWGAALAAYRTYTIDAVSGEYAIDITAFGEAVAAYTGDWFIHFGGGVPHLRLDGTGSRNAPYIKVAWEYVSATIRSDTDEAPLGSRMNFEITPEVTGEIHALLYAIGNQSEFIDTSGAYMLGGKMIIPWTPPRELATEFTDSAAGMARIRMTAYDSVGAVQRTEMLYQTLVAPSDMQPTISSSGVTLQNGLNGYGLTGRSKLSIAPAVSMDAAYGAQLVRVTAKITNGDSIQELTWTTFSENSPGVLTAAAQVSAILANAGSASVVITAVDSRGREAIDTTTVTVLGYQPPQVGAFSVERYEPVYDANEAITGYAPSDLGSHVWVNIQASVSSIMPAGAQLNRLTWSIFGQSDSGRTVTAGGSAALSANISRDRTYIPGEVAAGESWQYTLTVTDAAGGTAVKYSAVLPAHAALSVSPDKHGLAIGMIASGTAAAPKFEVAKEYEAIFYGGIRGVTDYSTAEVATGGKWIDGKPIYRKVFGNSVVISAGGATEVPTGIESLDTIVHLEAYVRYSGSIGLLNTVGNPANASANGTSIDIFNKANNTLRVRRGTAYAAIPIGDACFIMEYTKS